MIESNICFRCGKKGVRGKRVPFKSYKSYYCSKCRIRFVHLKPEKKEEDPTKIILKRGKKKKKTLINKKVEREMERVWRKLGWVKVKCPKCGWTQKTESMTQVSCFRCGKSYKVFTKTKRRVIGCPKGKKNLVQQLYKLNNTGKYIRYI